jgi:hypothetical protein
VCGRRDYSGVSSVVVWWLCLHFAATTEFRLACVATVAGPDETDNCESVLNVVVMRDNS